MFLVMEYGHASFWEILQNSDIMYFFLSSSPSIFYILFFDSS